MSGETHHYAGPSTPQGLANGTPVTILPRGRGGGRVVRDPDGRTWLVAREHVIAGPPPAPARRRLFRRRRAA